MISGGRGLEAQSFSYDGYKFVRASVEPPKRIASALLSSGYRFNCNVIMAQKNILPFSVNNTFL